jgi:UDP:flavonoid glycosyltransferase YjiC (YdhE family)
MRRMRVLAACSLGGSGHLQPLRPFLDAARRRGSETLVVGPPAIARLVEETGHDFAAGGEPPEAAVAPIRERLPVAPAREASVLGNRELFGRLATAAMLPAMERIVVDWKPDIVVRDPCEYASAVVAHRSGITTAQVAIGLAEVEWGSIAIAAPALENHRPGLTEELRRSPYLTRFPASLDPSPFPDTRRFRDAAAPVAPLPDWWNGARAPLIYVSFGTVLGHMSIAAEVYRIVLSAVAGIDARVLLTVGRRFDPDQLGDVPDNVHVEPWVDQSDVLAEADVVVCHGGSGTTFGALAAGVPLVIVPLFADQFANGPRVAEAEAGVVLDSGRDASGGRRPLSPARAVGIAAAIETVRGHPSFRQRAQRIAGEMAQAPTVDDVLDELTTAR